MSGIKSIIIAFLALGESAHAVKLSQAVKPILAPGQKLVGIGLMSHVPDNLILRQVQCQVQRHGKLHSSQIGPKVSTCDTDLFNEELPDLLRQSPVICPVYFLDIVWIFDLFQKHILFLSSGRYFVR